MAIIYLFIYLVYMTGFEPANLNAPDVALYQIELHIVEVWQRIELWFPDYKTGVFAIIRSYLLQIICFFSITYGLYDRIRTCDLIHPRDPRWPSCATYSGGMIEDRTLISWLQNRSNCHYTIIPF